MKSAPTILTLKHGSVFDPEKNSIQKQGAKNRVRIFFVIQKEKRQPGLFSFKLQTASRTSMVDLTN